MLSMLCGPQHRIVLDVHKWFGLPTVSGDLVQAADIAYWLTDLPWAVEYDEYLDAFVLSRVTSNR